MWNRLAGLRPTSRRVRAEPNATSRAPVVLMYHRVANLVVDPWELAVSPALFETQMRLAKSERDVLPLRQFVARLRDGTLGADALAITFDDGYADNVHLAAPILERHDLPATLFLATGFLGQEHEFWWDELGKLVLGSTSPAQTILDFAHSSLRSIERGSVVSLEAVHASIWSALRVQPLHQIELVLDALRKEFGPAAREPFDRPMREDEARLWISRGQNSLEPHSKTHPLMTRLDLTSLRQELAWSMSKCDELGGTPPYGFAYPYGDRSDGVARLARDLGIQWACSTRSGTVNLQTTNDLFDLPRLQVTNRSGARPWEHHDDR